jgi:HEAT repeat protein
MPFAAACPNAMTALSLDFSAYLDALCDRYQRWQILYTLTDVEGQQELQEKLENQPGQWDSPFDFGLVVQTAVRDEGAPNRGTGREEEKVERFPVLEGIRKYAQNHVLLVGRPGSGKSTALARLVFDEARQKRSIPVLVELRSWQRSIEALIGNALGRHGLILTEGQLRALWQDDRLLLLFDGLNELPSEEARSQLTAFRRDHPDISMIFTTRDLSMGGDFGIEKRLEMQPLTELQMREFVQKYIPELAEQMLRQLSDRLRELGQTPLLLWMLCALFRDTEKIPDNLGLVFRFFTQSYERKLKQDVPIESDREWWKPVLQQLAWVMMQGTQPTELRVTIGKAEAVRVIAQFLEGKVPYAEDFARKCLRDLQRHHLIQAGAGNEELEFRHQLIQEYYAAEALLERLSGLSDAVLQREYLNYLKWTEPVALTLALVESEEEALRVVQSGLEVDWFFGAKLAGKVKEEFQNQTVELVNALEFQVVSDGNRALENDKQTIRVVDGRVYKRPDLNPIVERNPELKAWHKAGMIYIPTLPDSLRVRLLRLTRSKASINILLPFLDSEELDFYSISIEALIEINHEDTIEVLTQAFKIGKHGIQTWIIRSLAEANTECCLLTINRIIECSNHDESIVGEINRLLDLVGWGAIVIPKINNEIKKVDNYLLEKLADESNPFDDFVIRIVNCLNIDPTLEVLIKQFLDNVGRTSFYFQHKLYKIMDFIDEKLIVAIAKKSLEEWNSSTCGNAIKFLSMRKTQFSPELVSFLLEILEIYDADMWSDAAKLLGEISQPETLPNLYEIFARQEIDKYPALYDLDALIHAIATIQSKCQYYNHELYSAAQAITSKVNEDRRLPELQTRTLLILAAAPTDRIHLRLGQETREIEEGLRRSKHHDRFTLHQRWAVRPDDLRRALLDHSPHILHFCGHGEGEPGIVLEDDRGKAKLVSTDAIANLFQLFADQGLECVILNACYSEIQADAIVQHIPYVIGMSDSILDTTALQFAIGFYDALGAGWSYEKAYAMGKSAIETEGIPEAHLPVLKRRQGGQK